MSSQPVSKTLPPITLGAMGTAVTMYVPAAPGWLDLFARRQPDARSCLLGEAVATRRLAQFSPSIHRRMTHCFPSVFVQIVWQCIGGTPADTQVPSGPCQGTEDVIGGQRQGRCGSRARLTTHFQRRAELTQLHLKKSPPPLRSRPPYYHSQADFHNGAPLCRSSLRRCKASAQCEEKVVQCDVVGPQCLEGIICWFAQPLDGALCCSFALSPPLHRGYTTPPKQIFANTRGISRFVTPNLPGACCYGHVNGVSKPTGTIQACNSDRATVLPNSRV
jgi:hypothetical protein